MLDLSRVKLNDESIRQAAKRPALPHGIYLFVFTQVEPEVKEVESGKLTGCLQIERRAQALKDPNDINSVVKPAMYHNLTLPLDNEGAVDLQGKPHKAPMWTHGICARDLQAVFPDEVTAVPEKDANGNWVFNGKEIEPEEIEEKRVEALTSSGEKALEVMASPEQFLGKTFVGEVGQDKTGQYTNIINMWAELPQGKEFYDFDNPREEKVEETEPEKKSPGKRKVKKGKK